MTVDQEADFSPTKTAMSTGSLPQPDMTDYVLEVRNEEGVLLTRYFLYASPRDITLPQTLVDRDNTEIRIHRLGEGPVI